MKLFSWIQRYRIRSFMKNAVWFPPVIGMLVAILLHRFTWWIDTQLPWEASVTTDGARALVGAFSAAMFTFIVFVFSILLLSVQLASAQLSPRIIAFFYRNAVLKFSLTVFVFSFTYSLGVLFRIDESVHQISLWMAVYSNLACIGIFLYMIDHVGKSLRPISIMNRIGGNGQEVIKQVYPKLQLESKSIDGNIVEAKMGKLSQIIEASDTGVILAFDLAGLVEMANRNNCLIELIPQVGDFISHGDPLFRLYQENEHQHTIKLYDLVAIGPERTMEQDPGFAFRIIVDIAIKALSPAINDPTTAVLALDQIYRLLRELARRRLDTGYEFDKQGNLRLIYRTPDWEDFVSLAITEIRQYGKDSLQVVRRLRNLLESLIKVVSQQLVKSLQDELEILNQSVDREFYHPSDRLLAYSSDSLGMGGRK